MTEQNVRECKFTITVKNTEGFVRFPQRIIVARIEIFLTQDLDLDKFYFIIIILNCHIIEIIFVACVKVPFFVILKVMFCHITIKFLHLII